MAKVVNTKYGYVVEMNGEYYMSCSTNGGYKFTTNYRLRRNFRNYTMAQIMADDINKAINEDA